MAHVSIVTPVYHNAGSLVDLFAEFCALARRNPKDYFEFIFVDDGSQDASLMVLRRIQRLDERVRVVKLSRNFGSNAAILAGLSTAKGDVVAAIAADLQDPPELIHEMLEHWRGGRKVVLAARAGRDDHWLTTLLANSFYALFRRFAIRTMPKRGFDFFLIDRQVCQLIKEIQESNAYLMGLLLWLGFDPKVIEYHRAKRPAEYGPSMWTLAKKLKYFVDSFVAFSHLPVKLASALGVVCSVLGVGYAAFIVLLRLAFGVSVEGWASLMVAVLLLSGLQLLIIGVFGEYLVRNLDETRRRPRFIVEEVFEGKADGASQAA